MDHLNARVQKYTADGRYISSFGAFGTGPGDFNYPWGISIDAEDCIWIVDWRNDRVQVFDMGGASRDPCRSRHIVQVVSGIPRRKPRAGQLAREFRHDQAGEAVLATRGNRHEFRWTGLHSRQLSPPNSRSTVASKRRCWSDRLDFVGELGRQRCPDDAASTVGVGHTPARCARVPFRAERGL